MSDSDFSLGISPSPENAGSLNDRDKAPPQTSIGHVDSSNDLADLDSELSEVDEAEFADFDPTTVALDDKPQIDIDEDVARTLKAGKRKRADKDGQSGTKKLKEAKRDKPKKKKTRTRAGAGEGGRVYDSGADGEILEGKRKPKPKRARIDSDGKDRERAKERRREIEQEENEENLTPEERRKRALDRAMDAALKNPNKRRRKKDDVASRTRCS
jgi:transcription factor SPN1